MKRLIVSVCATAFSFGLATCVQAAIEYDGESYPASTAEATEMGYITSEGSAGYGESHFGNAVQNSKGEYFWSSHNKPMSDCRYFCSQTRSVMATTVATTHGFAGDVFVMKGQIQWKTYAPSCMDLAKLVVLPGASIVGNESAAGLRGWLKGTLINLSSAQYPFTIKPDHADGNNQFFILDSELKGPETAVLAIKPNTTTRKNIGCIVRGETADYLGSVTVEKNDLILGGPGFANAAQVSVSDDSVLKMCAANDQTVTINNLAVDGSSSIELNVTNTLELTGSVDLPTGLLMTVDVSGAGPEGLSGVVLVKAPVGTDLESHLESISSSGIGAFRTISWNVRTVGDTEQAELTILPLVSLTVTDAAANDKMTALSSAMTNDASWTGGPKPTAGYDYQVMGNLELATLKETSSSVTQPVFPGESLTIGNQGWFALLQSKMQVERMRLCPGSSLVFGAGSKKTLTGNVEVRTAGAADYASVWAYYCLDKITNDLDSVISGDGSLRFIGYQWSGEPKGVVRLGGLNAEWKGRSIVTIETNAGKGTPAWDKTMYLFVTNGLALGGPLETPTFNSLQLEQFGAIGVQPGYDVCLSAVNRGVYVKDNGQAIVQGDARLTLANDVTYDGVFHKRGAGILALGGVARFGSDGAGSPTEDRNVVSVLEGSLQPTSTACLDGVAVSFASGTGLAYDVQPSDADFAADGVVLTKAASAWTSAEARIPVIFTSRVALEKKSYKVALLSGDENFCTTMNNRLNIVRSDDLRNAGLGVTVSIEKRAEGKYTLYANIEPKGLILIFR